MYYTFHLKNTSLHRHNVLCLNSERIVLLSTQLNGKNKTYLTRSIADARQHAEEMDPT